MPMPSLYCKANKTLAPNEAPKWQNQSSKKCKPEKTTTKITQNTSQKIRKSMNYTEKIVHQVIMHVKPKHKHKLQYNNINAGKNDKTIHHINASTNLFSPTNCEFSQTAKFESQSFSAGN